MSECVSILFSSHDADYLNCFKPIYGYGSSEAGIGFQQTREGEIFLVDDKEVDLVSIAMTEEHPASLGATVVKGNSVSSIFKVLEVPLHNE